MPKRLKRRRTAAAQAKIRRIRDSFLQNRNTLAIMPIALAWLQSYGALEAEVRPATEAWLMLADQHSAAGNIQISDSSDRYRPLPRRIMIGETAVIPIVGLMERKPSYVTEYGLGISTELLEAELQACLGDTRVKSIVLYADSPGGDAMGNEEFFNRVFAARGVKPISTFVRGYCCSAAYYVASATSRIVATPSSIIGSIGSMMVHQDYSKMLDDYGIKATVITYGESKAFGNPYEPLTAKSRELLQKLINDHGQQFSNAVARGRGVTLDTVLSKYGQGQIFLAQESLSIGLIDRIAMWDQFMAELPGNTPSNVEDRTTLASSLVSASSSSGGALPASTPIASSSGASAPLASITEESVMWKRIKAALFSQGLITDENVSDEVARGIVSGICAGRGQAMPSDEAQMLAIVQAAAVPATATPAVAPAPVASGAATPSVLAAHNREQEEARVQAAALAERGRIADLASRGRLLNVSQEQIDAATNEGLTIEAALVRWTNAQAAANPGVTTPARVVVIGHGSAMLEQDACNALLTRMNYGRLVPANQQNDNVRRLSNAPLFVLARNFLEATGRPVYDEYDKEAIVDEAMKLDAGKQIVRSEGGGSYSRPGSLPNLFSAVANRVLDDALSLANPTYTQWAGRWGTDLADFKPWTIVNKNNVDQLDEVLDAESFKQAFVNEEVISSLQLGRYGNTFTWTPVMIANDDLGALQEALLGFGIGHENTLNRLCLGQLTGNVALLDTYSLFDATYHKNDIQSGSGGAPSDAQWELMDNGMAAQTGVGGRGYVRANLNVALVPPPLKRKALQTFGRNGDDKVAATDATINVYRGDVDVIIEPELQNFSNTMWYGLVKPIGSLYSTVIYTFFAGYGAGGRRERWYDPNTKCFNFSLEGRFGAAVKQYRYIQRNYGA